ncbi:ABC transporter ATP-binding protein [Phytoactinopolyspora halotolerans]|uniref:ABC transporter ATP-binding protein n=1 Tax=Phytoactinopolyspora halotolerans TaxID=1981512 RepID=A0A6L9S5R2_9ACTN|nr:ABC transporter ATP-binding protein [Phytoactinopolyspora halotolerans]NEE00387.1 ABC transporter ATP-binding protein [Phytoactinopolyspora halotolerans]
MATETVQTPATPELAADVLLSVRNLQTHFPLDQGLVKAVDGAGFEIRRGKTLCVVGESGCGKSVTARSILQIVDRPGRVVGGELLFRQTPRNDDGRPDAAQHGQERIVDLAKLSPKSAAMRAIRGRDIAMIFQEPMTSLSPVHTIGNQIVEVIHLHENVSKKEAKERAIEVLRRVGVPRPEQRFDSHPFQLSGGLRQRAMIAMALVCNPTLLIADEPTTALDVTTQAQILELMRELQSDYGMAIMFITHDLGVVAEMADDVAVMYLGTVAERGDVESVFRDPQHPYTRALLHSIPKVGAAARAREKLDTIRGMVPDPYNRPGGCPFHNRCDEMMPGVCDRILPPPTTLGEHREVRCLLHDPELISSNGGTVGAAETEDASRDLATEPRPTVVPDAAGGSTPDGDARSTLLDVEDLRLHFPIRTGFLRRTTGHVRAVDGLTFAISEGETLGLVGESGCGKTSTGRCIVRSHDPTGGRILYRENGSPAVDLAQLAGPELKPYRRAVRMIFQDPHSSLNPRMTLRDIIGEPLRAHGVASGSELEDRVGELLRDVGLRPEYMSRYPHAFSGGERQRVGIARALSLDPRLVVADEAVSALDVSVRAQILNLLQDLQAEHQLTYLFISHDLSVVEYLCDRVAVMYVGKIVELADTATLYARPRHPYTEALLSAVPKPDPRTRDRRERIVLSGDVADPSDPPSGCYFHPRCRYAKPVCAEEQPQLRDVGDGTTVACHFAEELTLRGVADGASTVTTTPK